jgi:Trp operon repressor
MSKPKKEETIEVPNTIVAELLTDSEIRMIKQRYKIIQLLARGLSIREISKEVEVGTDTVVRVSKKLRDSAQLQKVFEQFKTPEVSTSKWIFGQVGSEEE